MSLLSRLFGGSKGGDAAPAAAGPAEEHKGFTITPTPIREGGSFRVSARIEKGDQTHTLIRADTINDQEAALAASVRKAKQLIDEQGDRLFG